MTGFVTKFDMFRRIKGMQYWKGMSQAERSSLRKFIKMNNLDLEIVDVITQDVSPFQYKVRPEVRGVRWNNLLI